MDWWIVVLRKERLHPILNSLDKATVSVLLSSLSLSVLTSLNRSLSNSITLSCQGVSLLAAFNRTDLRWLPRWICTYILVRRGERKKERERERERERRERKERERSERSCLYERTTANNTSMSTSTSATSRSIPCSAIFKYNQ